jgi:hypothetical protein
MTRHVLLALGLIVLPASGLPQDEKKKDDKEALKEKTQRHKKDVTELRSLEFKNEVAVGVYSKKELLGFLKAEFEKELPRDKAERFQRGYAKFGLIPRDLDLYEAYMELFGSSIAGFYHPKTKELRLIKPGDDETLTDVMAKMMESVTLVHELTHAAQDQAFELSTLPLEDETNDDLIMALKGVIEGDASAVGWKYMLKEDFNARIGMINSMYKSGQLPGKANSLPDYLKQTLTFAYGYGTEFVVEYLKGTQGELRDSSKLFKDLPLSSEQILHPKKYYETRDNPTLVTLPDLGKTFGAPWKETFNNVHGEFSIRILLRQFRGERLRLAQINRASEGWDGDRYVVLEDDKNTPMYAWYSTWDSEDDAKEFTEAYTAALEKKYEFAEAQGDPANRTAFKAAGGHVLVERRGKDVLVLDGAAEGMLGKAGELWKGVKKAEMTAVERVKRFTCEKDGVKEAFSGKCPKCGADLKYVDEKDLPKKKKRDYSVPPGQ